MRRSGFTLVELLVAVAIIAILVSLLMPSLAGGREVSRQAYCAANLRGVGQGLVIYFDENNRIYPTHYFEPRANPEAFRPNGIEWVGTMGSTERLLISQETSRDLSPTVSHPSRSLFLLVTGGMAVPAQFVCPSTENIVDELYNYDTDCPPEERPEFRSTPGRNRFDFRGLESLSYGYQMPFGPLGRLGKHTKPEAPMMADRSPYSLEAVALNNTITDQRAADPAKNIRRRDWRQWKPFQWEPYNSLNHDSTGQNVLFLGGNVKFKKTPMIGLKEDNIYFVQHLADRDPGNIGDLGHAPTRKGDTYLVP